MRADAVLTVTGLETTLHSASTDEHNEERARESCRSDRPRRQAALWAADVVCAGRIGEAGVARGHVRGRFPAGRVPRTRLEDRRISPGEHPKVVAGATVFVRRLSCQPRARLRPRKEALEARRARVGRRSASLHRIRGSARGACVHERTKRDSAHSASWRAPYARIPAMPYAPVRAHPESGPRPNSGLYQPARRGPLAATVSGVLQRLASARCRRSAVRHVH